MHFHLEVIFNNLFINLRQPLKYSLAYSKTSGSVITCACLFMYISGQMPAESDYRLLEVACRLEMFGIRLHSAKDREGTKLSLAVAHGGVLVFQVHAITHSLSLSHTHTHTHTHEQQLDMSCVLLRDTTGSTTSIGLKSAS